MPPQPVSNAYPRLLGVSERDTAGPGWRWGWRRHSAQAHRAGRAGVGPGRLHSEDGRTERVVADWPGAPLALVSVLVAVGVDPAVVGEGVGDGLHELVAADDAEPVEDAVPEGVGGVDRVDAAGGAGVRLVGQVGVGDPRAAANGRGVPGAPGGPEAALGVAAWRHHEVHGAGVVAEVRDRTLGGAVDVRIYRGGG